jgi:hypothetical protein
MASGFWPLFGVLTIHKCNTWIILHFIVYMNQGTEIKHLEALDTGFLSVPRYCVNFHIKMKDSASWGLLSVAEGYMK